MKFSILKQKKVSAPQGGRPEVGVGVFDGVGVKGGASVAGGVDVKVGADISFYIKNVPFLLT